MVENYGEVIEKFCIGKDGSPNSGDDRLFIGRGVVAVIDGVTSRAVCARCSSPAGSLAGDALVTCLSALEPTQTLSGFLAAAQAAITEAADRHAIEPGSLRASAAVWNGLRREIWLVGDCQARISGSTIRHEKRIDTAASVVRSAVLRASLMSGASTAELRAADPGREAIRPLLDSQGALANTLAAGDLAYAVLSTTTTPEELCRVIAVPDPDCDIILATDGYPELFDDLASTERNLARLLEKDPLCIGPLRSTKGVAPGNESFDDRAYARIRRSA